MAVLLASRVVGILREFCVALAFGFSRVTDLFYQTTWPLTALLTVTNGPFTTAFSARLVQVPEQHRGPYIAHYRALTVRVGLALMALFLLAAVGSWIFGAQELAIVLAILSPAVLGLAITGYYYALATTYGWVTFAAVLTFVGNFGFVGGVVLFWATGLPLSSWTLPALYTTGIIGGTWLCRGVSRQVEVLSPSGTSTRRPLPGFGQAFLLAGIETAGFLSTQAILLALATATGEGWVSALALVQRVVFSVNGLIINPLASLVMLNLVRYPSAARKTFSEALIRTSIGLGMLALCLGLAVPLLGARLDFFTPKHASLEHVLGLLPSFSLWLLPMALNVLVCRTMFGLKLDRLYTTVTVLGHVSANVVRLLALPLGGLGLSVAAGAVIELCAVAFLVHRILSHLTDAAPETQLPSVKAPGLAVFTMAGHSGMGRFATELTNATSSVWPGPVTLIAPPMEHEPRVAERLLLPGPERQGSRWRRLWRLLTMNVASALLVWKTVRSGQVFLMIDVFATVPLSVLPALAAKARGATCVLNVHDFYPHSLRYPSWMAALERAAYRFTYRRFDLIAAMKPAQIPRLVSEAGIAASKIIQIQHGTVAVAGVNPPAEGDPIRVLILGSLRENKRIFESIEAVRLLMLQGFNVCLRIAGAPRREEPKYWERCQKALIELQKVKGAAGAVEVVARYIDDSELPQVLSGVDAFLCPYEDFDSQSAVSVLAVSSGVPLIATKEAQVQGCDPLFEVMSPVTPQAIAAALIPMFSQPREARRTHAVAMQSRLYSRSLWVESAAAIAAAVGVDTSKAVPRTEEAPQS